MRVLLVRRTIPVLCLLVFAATLFLVQAQSGPLDGPTPPPGAKPDKIFCASIYSGERMIHVQLDHPIHNDADSVRAGFISIGQEMQRKALATGVEKDRRLGVAIVQAAVDQSTWTGTVCYYRVAHGGLVVTGCAQGCNGQGCMGILAPSIE